MIIGLGFKKRSGKDTVADHLTRVHGFQKFSWADPLKEACKAAFDWTDEHVHGDLKEVVDPRWGFTPRHALQHVGTELFRNWIEDFWVRRTMMAIREGDRIVIADVRFPNEARAIKEAGGVLWRIDRPLLESDDTHPSETSMENYEDWDAIVENSDTLDFLLGLVDMLVDEQQG
jgi:hypothetical protein